VKRKGGQAERRTVRDRGTVPHLPPFRRSAFPSLLLLLSACATKGQVQLLQNEVRTMRIETARRDSSRAAALAAVLRLQDQILDSIAAGREALRTLDVRLQGDLTDVQRQILAVQELTGQSQRRLSEMKAQLDARAEQVAAAAAGRPAPAADSTGAAAAASPTPAPPSATADQMYQGARQQLNRGSLSTARRGFQEFLAAYPTHELVPDALYSVGETFYFTAPDSALAYYAQVVARFPKAAKASTALYKMGHVEEDRKNAAAARTQYERLLKEYPASPEADIARNRLRNLRP
jgi:tol-pal system protein YbgF